MALPVLTFSDAFDGLSAKWSFETGFAGGTTFSSPVYDGFNPTSIKGGLNMLAGWTPGPSAKYNGPYRGTKISTRGSFTQAYGYFQVEMAASANSGQLGGAYLSNGLVIGEVASGADAPDLKTHTYGLLWTPNLLARFVDGKLVSQIVGKTPSAAAFVVLQNVIVKKPVSGGFLVIHSLKTQGLNTMGLITGPDGRIINIGGGLISFTASAGPSAPSYAPGYKLVFSDDFSAGMVPIRNEAIGAAGVYEDKYWYGYPGYVTSHWDGAGPTTAVSPAWSGDAIYDAAGGVYNAYTKFKTAGAAYPSDTKYGSGSTYLGGILTTAPNYNDLQSQNTLTTAPAITSGKTFYRGLFECDVKTPNKPGYWPCFWLYCDWMGRKKEIDIVEFQTIRLDQTHRGYHVPNQYSQPRPSTPDITDYLTLPNSGQTSDWHRYSLRWDDDLTFFVDGVQVAQYVGIGKYFDAPMWIIRSGGAGDGAFYPQTPNTMAAGDAGLPAQFRNMQVWQL